MSATDKELKKIARSLRKPKSEADRMMSQALAKQAKELLNKKEQEQYKVNVNQQLLEALVAVRSCMAIGIPEFSLHDREVMIQADNAIDAAIAAAQEVGNE